MVPPLPDDWDRPVTDLLKDYRNRGGSPQDERWRQWRIYRQEQAEEKAREKEQEKQRKKAEKEAEKKRRALEKEREKKRKEVQKEAERLKRVEESKKREQEKQKREAEHIEGRRLLSEIDYKRINRYLEITRLQDESSPKPDSHITDRLKLSVRSSTDQQYRHEFSQKALEIAINNKKSTGHCYATLKPTLKNILGLSVDFDTWVNNTYRPKGSPDITTCSPPPKPEDWASYRCNAYRTADILEKFPDKVVEIHVPLAYQGIRNKLKNNENFYYYDKEAVNWLKELPEGAIIVFDRSTENFGKDFPAHPWGHVAIRVNKPDGTIGFASETFTDILGPHAFGNIRVFLPTKLPQ